MADVVGEGAEERDRLARLLYESAVLSRPDASIRGEAGMVHYVPDHADDKDLVARIIDAFRVTKDLPLGDSASFWLDSIAGMQKREFETLSSGAVGAVAALFRDPLLTQLFVGFDDVVATNPYSPHVRDPSFQDWMRKWSYDSLVGTAEAVGTVRIEAVESRDIRALGVEEILLGLDEAFGFRVTFPNINRGEIGLTTSRGIASFRAIQSLFQGWRIANLLGDTAGKKVVEIGGGMGRTCFYARQFGVAKYDIVDLPLTSACQAYYLGRTLGNDQVALHGEDSEAPTRILAPSTFLNSTNAYDLAVNVDSFPEMSGNTIAEYFNRIVQTIPSLLSINHEANLHSVRYFIDTTQGAVSTRNRYWLRRGFVEEVVRFS